MPNIDVNRLKRLFSTLSNTQRLNILILCEKDKHNIGSISNKLGLGYTTTSEYVTSLEREGLVKKVKEDKEVYVVSLVTLNDRGEIKFK